MNNVVEKVLIDEQTLQAKVSEFARILSEEYADKDPVLWVCLKVLFCSSLM